MPWCVGCFINHTLFSAFRYNSILSTATATTHRTLTTIKAKITNTTTTTTSPAIHFNKAIENQMRLKQS